MIARMRLRRAIPVALLVVGAMILAGRARSNGTCVFSITGGSASITVPTSGACYTDGMNVTPAANWTLNWKVSAITPSTENICDVKVFWNQTGNMSDSGCGYSHESGDWINNARVGDTGTFGWTVNKSFEWGPCDITGSLGEYAATAQSTWGGSGEGSPGSAAYWVKVMCP